MILLLRRDRMRRFVEGIDREQGTLFPECLADWIDEDNPVRVIDAFVDKLDLSRLEFDGMAPEATGRPMRRFHNQRTPGWARYPHRILSASSPRSILPA